MGSVLIGTRTFITQARRIRKRLGGGMRQAGIAAAAGLYALDHHIERLAEDHSRAKHLEAALAGLPYVEQVVPVQTNIVITVLKPFLPAQDLVLRLRGKGVLASRISPDRVRMVTHLDVDDDAIDQTIAILRSLA